MSFMEKLHTVLNDNKKVTENGVIGYETTGKALVGLSWHFPTTTVPIPI